MLALTQMEYAQAVATSVATQQQPSTEVSRVLQRTQSVDRSKVLSLDNIRQSLVRQEDSIIFSLIERSQFAHNEPVYEPDSIPVPGYAESGQRYSLLDYLMQETEQLHGKIRRYTSPDEHPFFPEALPPLVLPPITYSEVRTASGRCVHAFSHGVLHRMQGFCHGLWQCDTKQAHLRVQVEPLQGVP